MKRSSKIILSIFTPIIALLVVCFALAFLTPNCLAIADIDNGGAVYVETGTTFNFSNGTISGKNAETGGGVYAKNATFNMTGGTISGNTATTDGGGVCLIQSEMTMSAGEISGNTATSGGGVYLGNSTFVMTGGTITNNTAGWGSAIYMYYDSTLELRGGTINGIVTGDRDGGVVNYYDCTFTGGYIEIDGIYDLVICKAITKDIPIKIYDGAGAGAIVARLADGIIATDAILGHIKVQNMPAGMKLAYSGRNIVLERIYYTISLAASPSGYGNFASTTTGRSGSSYTVSVPYGATWSTSGNSNTITFYNGSTTIDRINANAVDTVQYDRSFTGWSCVTTGTVTGNATITAYFTQQTRKYTVTMIRTGYNEAETTIWTDSVAYGTTYTTEYKNSNNVFTISGGQSYSCYTNSSLGFRIWLVNKQEVSNGSTGTITGDTTVYAFYGWKVTVTGCSPSYVWVKDGTSISYSNSTKKITFGDGQVMTVTNTSFTHFEFNLSTASVHSDISGRAADPGDIEGPDIFDEYYDGTGNRFSAETAFIDKRKEYAVIEAVNKKRLYKTFDICYPL